MPESNRTDTLDYLQTMLGQLRTMAQAERYDMVAYLIEMAYVETSDIIRGARPKRSGRARRALPAEEPLGPDKLH